MEKITEHGKRVDSIVKSMLQHTRTSSGQKEKTDINLLAEEYLRLSYHGMRAKEKNFTIILDTIFDEHIGNINVIPQDIAKVLLNIYNNAFYAVLKKSKMDQNGYEPKITVTTSLEDRTTGSDNSALSNFLGESYPKRVIITVSDNGNGIPQKVLEKIFHPFYTTKPTGEGTGLGLSLSYDIIKAHGGKIEVKSKEGEGASFIISLPG
jgi:signal transduction histidine kinase